MCFYAPNSVYLQFAAIHSPCISVVSKQKRDVLIVYETLLCFSIWAGKLNVFFLSQDHAGLFKAGCLCNSPLVAVHLHSFSQYTKVGAKGMTEPKERALTQEKRLKKMLSKNIFQVTFLNILMQVAGKKEKIER